MDTIQAATALTVPEAIARLRISKSTFFRRIDDGTIRTVRLGRRILIRAEEIERVLLAHEGVKEPATEPAPLPPTTEPRRRS